MLAMANKSAIVDTVVILSFPDIIIFSIAKTVTCGPENDPKYINLIAKCYNWV